MVAVLALAWLAVPAQAQQSSADVVLARSAEATLTRADWEAELMRVPADQRIAFATSPQRVQTALNNLLVNRTLAERARALGLDKDPMAQRRIALEMERTLAALMMERADADAGAEFDRAAEKNLARAREVYVVNPGRFRVPEEVDTRHILFDTTKRGKDAALAAALETRAKLLAGADFATLAAELSDDPTATRNKGKLGYGARGRLDPAFEAAAFALAKQGDLSEPVLTRFGYHIIRLEGRRPARQQTFEQAQIQILAEMRQKHVNDARDAILSPIRSNKELQVNQDAVDALVVKVDMPPMPASPRKPATPDAPPAAK